MKPEALHGCLSRLLPHVHASRVALTGGVAIGVHLWAASGDPTRGYDAEDVDFVADNVHAVSETVTTDFLVSHFHLARPRHWKFLVQLVDPIASLRIDFFPDTLGALARASLVTVAGVRIPVLAARDILDHKIALLSSASASNPVDEKHYADAERLAEMGGFCVPVPKVSHLGKTVYSQRVDEACVRCEESHHSGFPLAPKQAIFELLGYV